MGAIVPALLVANENELKEKLVKINGVVNDIQIDAIDGKFASPAVWPYVETSVDFSQWIQQEKMLPCYERFNVEADLMVTDISSAVDTWDAVGASRLVLHAKDIADIESTLSHLEEHFGYEKGSAPSIISIGVALTVEDDPKSLDSIIDRINFIQCMGITHIGRQGEVFDERVLDLMHSIRLYHRNIPIQVDGGISLKTAPKVLRAGANRLIIGSAIWKSLNVVETIHEFEDMVQQYGTYE